jgi:ABC-type iron transport system FetAB permease component
MNNDATSITPCHHAYNQLFGTLFGQMFSGGSPLDYCRIAIVIMLCAAPIAADITSFL